MALSVNRGSLPTNFLDLVNEQGLMLPQPEPQYLLAKFATAGRLSLAALDAGAPTAQQFVSMAGGGKPVSPVLDELAMAADTFPGFVNAVNDFGKGQGDTIKFQRPVFSTGGTTLAARKLNTDASISTTGMGITMEEVPLSVDVYNGPYSSGGSAVQPYAIWEFDAKYRANKFQLAGLVSLNLVRDYTIWLDTVMRTLITTGQYTTLADSSYANVASFVQGGNQKFSWECIERGRKTLRDRYWQPFSNGRYLLLVPTQFRLDMADDVDYRQLSAPNPAYNQLFGYVSSVGDIDIFEYARSQQFAAAASVLGDKAGTVGSGVTLEQAIMIGPGALGFGTAQDPHTRWADDTNYGNVAKVIWQAAHAIGMLDERGIQRVLAQST